VRHHDCARRGLQGRAHGGRDPSRRAGDTAITRGRFASASSRPTGRHTGGRRLALCVSSLAVASVLASHRTQGPSALTPAAIAATVRPAVRSAAIAHAASPTAESPKVTPTSRSRRSASRAQVHAACRTSELRLTRETAGVAAGTSYTWYTLTSVGRAGCSMIGYPGVAILDAHGRIVQHPAVWSTHPGTMPPERVRRIVLATGQQARFVLASTDVTPSPGCRAPYSGSTLQVYPPNQTAAILKAYRERFCNLIVGPLQPPRRQRPGDVRLGLTGQASVVGGCREERRFGLARAEGRV
jgi:Domain of unknown function (DUF4232)